MTDAGVSEFGGRTVISRTDAASIDMNKSRKTGGTLLSSVHDDDSEEEDASVVIPRKFKADTDTKNILFE